MYIKNLTWAFEDSWIFVIVIIEVLKWLSQLSKFLTIKPLNIKVKNRVGHELFYITLPRDEDIGPTFNWVFE